MTMRARKHVRLLRPNCVANATGSVASAGDRTIVRVRDTVRRESCQRDAQDIPGFMLNCDRQFDAGLTHKEMAGTDDQADQTARVRMKTA